MASQQAIKLLKFAFRSVPAASKSRFTGLHSRFFSNNSRRLVGTSFSRFSMPISTKSSSNRNRHNESCNGRYRFGQPAVFMGIIAYFTGEKYEKEETLEDKVLNKIKRAIMAIQRERYPKAENFLNEALDLCKDIPIAEEIKTQILDIRANMYLHIGELDKAEEAFKEVAQRLVNTGRVPASDNSIVEISIKLSEIYKLQNNLEQAEMGYKYSIDCQQAKLDKLEEKDEDTILLAAWANHGMGQMLVARAEASQNSSDLVARAKQHIQKAYDLTVEVTGDSSHQAIAVRSDLATVEAMEGKVDEAVSILEDLSDKSLAANDQALYGTVRINLGNVLLQNEQFQDAFSACREVQVLASISNDTNLRKRAQNCILTAENGINRQLSHAAGKPK